jgi:replicative DNA helicase
MEMKKYGMTTIIQLSQMNRNIEDKERILNPSLQFPMRSDIMASDTIFQASDYIIVLHRPEILGITAYGPGNWPVKNLVYAHVIKNREGEPKILVFENNLKYNTLDEHNVLSNI